MLKPDASHPYFRARFIDPDSGQVTKVKLDPLALPTFETRRAWCIRKSKSLAKRRMELLDGAPRTTGTAFAAAVGKYFETHPDLRPKTRAAYQAAAKKLLAWAERSGVASADDVTRARLIAFRDQLVAEPKRAAARKGKRGERRETARRRSPSSVNRELRGVRVVLNYLAELDLLPRVREGELRRALKLLKPNRPAPVFLRPPEIAALLEAALAHDREMFKITRREHAGDAQRGTTARFEPVAPFVATVLLTGMRLGEAVDLEWSQVDLTALDHDGKTPVGEIALTEETKTKTARKIDLAVSPKLRELLVVLRDSGKKKGPVFTVTHAGAAAIAKRLRDKYEAPASFGWQALRSTCDTYLVNAPGIFGAASAYRSARQLGHSVQVAEKFYQGLIRLPPTARTLEDAMSIVDVLDRVVAAAKTEGKRK